MSQDAKCQAGDTEPNSPPKPQNPPANAEPKPAQTPPALDMTDEEWIAAS